MSDIPYSAQITKRALLRALVVVTVLLGLTPALIVGGVMGVWAYRHAYQAGHNDGYSEGFRDGAGMP